MNTHTAEAEIRVGTPDVREDLPFFTKKLGFRLDRIFPADYPRVAVLSGYTGSGSELIATRRKRPLRCAYSATIQAVLPMAIPS